MTPLASGTAGPERHHCQARGVDDGVKGRSRRQPVRAAQPLRPSSTASTIEQPSDLRQATITSVASVAAGQLDAGKRVEIKIDNGLQGIRGCRALKRVR
jgi:hypothetical protein